MANYGESDLKAVVAEDVRVLMEKDRDYGRSWLKRGGVGAAMMLARKWDRIETKIATMTTIPDRGVIGSWDIFGHCLADQRKEGLLDDIQDLRRYLVLVEAHLRAAVLPPQRAPVMSEEWRKNAVGERRVDNTGQERPFGFDPGLDAV